MPTSAETWTTCWSKPVTPRLRSSPSLPKSATKIYRLLLCRRKPSKWVPAIISLIDDSEHAMHHGLSPKILRTC